MKAVIYGAGNIGRGFIGQLLSESGYDVVFLDINKEIINRLSDEKHYNIYLVSHENIKKITVNNVSGVNSLAQQDAVNEIFTADIMATSVGANVLKYIAKPIALAIEKRIKANKSPLNIMLCENLKEADKY